MTKYSLLFLFAFGCIRSFGQSVPQDTLLRWLKDSKELYSTGDYARSAELAWACVKAAQQQQLPTIAGKAYTLLARGAFQLQDIKQGLLYGRAGCNALRQVGQPGDLGEALTVMSIFMLATQQLDSAYLYSQQAVQAYHQAGDPLGEAIAYSKMGHVFNLKGEYTSATPYYLRCYELSRQDTLSIAYMTANLSLASNYIYQKKPDAALVHNRKAYQTAKALNSFYEISTALYYFSGIYELKGDFPAALQYQRQYADVRDSVLKAERVQQVKKLEIQYQTAEKETAIQLLEKNKSQQRAVLWAVLATLALLLVVAVQIYRSYRRRTSDNRILTAANTSLEAEKIRTALQLEAEARERERLSEMDAFKSRFFTNITHEFRTPLTVILGMAGRLEATLAEPAAGAQQQQTAITLIKRNGQNLLRLINEILDLAKLENNNLKINYVQGDVLAYLRYIAESMHSLANTRNVLLRVESDQAAIQMDYDPERLLQIAHNLLSNAIKFTPSGGRVTLQVNTLAHPIAENNEEPSALGKLCIAVADTGAGIAPADLPHLFDRFFQADNQDQANAGGTGIGLSLTRELVKIMGGEMEVESTLGKGSIFRVYLPIRRQASPEASVPQPMWAPGDAAPSAGRAIQAPQSDTQVLVIEDNPDVVEYLAACLGSEYQLEFAYNGRSGIEQALETVPDIIISDVMMPEKDGYEVCNTLKNDERTSHVPLILLTAKATAADRIAGLRRGADAYLAKPFVEEELLVVIRNLLETRQKLQAKYRSGAAAPEASPEAPSAMPPTDLENIFLKKTIDLIEANIEHADFGNAELARHMLMSESQLHRKIKALTDQSLSLFIRSVRLRRGRTLLETTDMNVSEVAYATGFSDPAYFSRTFSAEFGVAPTAVRKSK